jgi:ankyrin repeat protein
MDSFLSLIKAKRFDEAKQSEGWLKHRDPALCWACAEGDLACVQWFLAEGANPAFEKNAPLFMACEYGHTAIVKLLLGYSAAVAAAHEHRNRCLFAAQREEFEDIEALLLAIPAVAAGPSMRKWGYGLLDD